MSEVSDESLPPNMMLKLSSELPSFDINTMTSEGMVEPIIGISIIICRLLRSPKAPVNDEPFSTRLIKLRPVTASTKAAILNKADLPSSLTCSLTHAFLSELTTYPVWHVDHTSAELVLPPIQ